MKNELLTSFSNTGSEVGLPAFQLPTYAKCDALPQRDFFGMFVSGVGSCRSFLQRHFFSWRDQRVCKQGLTHWVGSRESQPSSNIVRVDVWVVNQWWIRMILACEFSVPKFAVLARSKKLMPVAVKFRLGFLVCGLQVHLLWHQAISAPCFHVTKRKPQWRIVEIGFLATVGWKCGGQAFRCPCSENVIHCRKEVYARCLSKESMPFVKSKPPLPTRSLRSLRAVARSTSSALWLHQLHHACKR